MTNVEINLQNAVAALNDNLLNEAETKFIKQIKDYDKKQLKNLTSPQFNWLRDIAKKSSK